MSYLFARIRLFPGRIPLEALDAECGDYYYQQSNRLIGIGAFPLRPDQELHANDGSIIIDANSSEQALRNQIRHWLEDDNGREQLLCVLLYRREADGYIRRKWFQ